MTFFLDGLWIFRPEIFRSAFHLSSSPLSQVLFLVGETFVALTIMPLTRRSFSQDHHPSASPSSSSTGLHKRRDRNKTDSMHDNDSSTSRPENADANSDVQSTAHQIVEELQQEDAGSTYVSFPPLKYKWCCLLRFESNVLFSFTTCRWLLQWLS